MPTKLKAHRGHIGALWTAIGDISALYSEQECWNYLKAAGYAPELAFGALDPSLRSG